MALPMSGRLSRRFFSVSSLAALMVSPSLQTLAQLPAGSQLEKPVISNSGIQLKWNSGGDLEVAPSPNGPWKRLNSSTEKVSRSQLPLELEGHRFFRIVDNGIPGAIQPIVEGDPRRPYRIQTAFLRRGPTDNPNSSRLEVHFETNQSVPDKVPLLVNGSVLVFNDAGQDADVKAGDGFHSAFIVLSLEELKETNDLLASLPENVRKRAVFKGREFTGVEELGGFDLVAFEKGEPIQVFPSPFAGGGIKLGQLSRKARLAGMPVLDPLPPETLTPTNTPSIPNVIPPAVSPFARTNVVTGNIITEADLGGTSLIILRPEPGKPVVIGGNIVIQPLPPSGVLPPPDAGIVVPPGTGIRFPGLDDFFVLTLGGILPPQLPPITFIPNFPLLPLPQHPIPSPNPLPPLTNALPIDPTLPPTLPPILPPPPPIAGGDVLKKSLLVTDLSVVEDPRRTWDPCRPHQGTRLGAWTFGKLMIDMANEPKSGIKPHDFVRRWLRSWQTEQVINFDTVTNRNAEIMDQVIRDWETASGGPDKPLDLSIAPFRLLAIVNRVDLRGNPGYGAASTEDPCNPPCIGGEARFVFGVVPGLKRPIAALPQPGVRTSNARPAYPDPLPNPNPTNDVDGVCGELPFTVILEYCVPKNTCDQIRQWGLEWFNLSRMPFGPEFNDALQRLTDQFATAGADPRRKPNESALSQLRANDLLHKPWEMREWRIFPNDSDVGHLREVTTKQTPDFDHNFSKLIVEYCNTFSADILAGRHTVPLQFGTPLVPFLSGSAPMSDENFFWDGPPPRGTSIPTPVRHNFSLNTCSGCHAGETGTPFTHVFTRLAGQEAKLSDFLTGLNMPKLDPADGVTPHHFADLKRREQDLLELIGTPCFFQIFKQPIEMKH